MKTKIFYPLTDDICFKYIFGRNDILKDFLNSFFEYIGEKKKVKKVEITTQKEMIGSRRKNKVFDGDILAYLDTDEIVSVEIYNRFNENEYKKSVSYLTRIYSDQLETGEDYLQAKKVISLNLMEGNYHLNNFQLVNDYGFVNKLNYGKIKDECLELYLIRLDLVKEDVYNYKEIRFIRWLKLIKAGDLEEMKKIAEGDENMEKVLKFMKRFVNDEEVLNLYDKINDVKYYAKEEGKETGKKEEKLETAKNMLADNIDISKIMKYTGLSKEEIEAL